MAPQLQFEDICLGETMLTRVSPGDWIMKKGYEDFAEKMYNFELRSDDIWFIGHPKTGKTWTAEIIWSVCNNGDINGIKNEPHYSRWCSPELNCYVADAYKKKLKENNLPEKLRRYLQTDFYEKAINQKSQRLIKSHYPLSLLPPRLLDTCKVIYVCRNPMDTCLSYYHFTRSTNLKADFDLDMFVKSFQAEILPLSPYRKHVKEAWEKRNHPNMFFMTYEGLRNNVPGVVKKLSDFVNASLSEETIDQICKALTFENMKNNPNVNMSIGKATGLIKENGQLMRKGVVGDFKNQLPAELSESIKSWWNEEMGDTGLSFAGINLH